MSPFDIWNKRPDLSKSNDPDVSLYGQEPEKRHGSFSWDYEHGTFAGKLPGEEKATTEIKIAFTIQGDRGPVVLLLHGVPTNRFQYAPIQSLLSRFCRTVSIDLLGMGQSSMPLRERVDSWHWAHDVPYVDALMKELFGEEKFFFVADDWGSGVCQHYTARFDSSRLLGSVNIDPVAGGGYPVAEIQAIGRSHKLPEDQFRAAMGAFDQTLVQILKTMTYDPNKWNQWILRKVKFPYADVDYESSGAAGPASSDSLGLNFHNIRVLAQRASVLSPSTLLPYDQDRNPTGVNFGAITVPQLVLWGAQDNMMPAEQGWRFIHQMGNARVQFTKIGRAGHFAGIDQPKEVSEEILKFVMSVLGPGGLAQPCLGFTGIWKGDEKRLLSDLRETYSARLRQSTHTGGNPPPRPERVA